ncbi:MAG: hypothetical protein QOJ55_2507, partial [Solirubrobacteraceae bacterium]|nr:hypothetical protein [Solirubrobacteraceae bacterium]
ALDRREQRAQTSAERDARTLDEGALADVEAHRRMAAMQARQELEAAEERIKKAAAAEAAMADRYLDAQRQVYDVFVDTLERVVLRETPEWASAWAEKAAREMDAEIERNLNGGSAVA